MTPESSTAIPTPLPSRPLKPALLRVRTALAPVACSSALGCSDKAVRAVMRLGEMPCTSANAAISSKRWAGSNTDSAATEV